jgi:hypothetical protein
MRFYFRRVCVNLMKKDDIESALAFTMDEGTGGPASGELSVADPDARRDQAPGMPGAFHQASRAAAVGGLCQLVQVHEPSGNDGPLTIHPVLPLRSAAF